MSGIGVWTHLLPFAFLSRELQVVRLVGFHPGQGEAHPTLLLLGGVVGHQRDVLRGQGRVEVGRRKKAHLDVGVGRQAFEIQRYQGRHGG